jgi:TfoX/Sxy family transcriptional regulator of competence genes
MSFDEHTADRIRGALGERDDVSERRMFGGLCFMIGGHMLCGLTKAELMVRVGPEAYEDALRQPHARPMDFTGRPLAGFVYVDAAGMKTRAALAKWVKRAIDYVSTLPPKKPRARRLRKARPGQRAS